MERPAGRIEAIAGPMFAGKTEELLRRVRGADIAGRHVQVFTHALDQRGGTERIASRAGLEHPSQPVRSAAEIPKSVRPETDVVAIDEAHFFGSNLDLAVEEVAGRGVLVVVAGLDVTFAGRPFEPMPSLMALAEGVDKLTAICTVCGAEAVFHQRTVPGMAVATDLVAENVGGSEKYEARCRRHFEPS